MKISTREISLIILMLLVIPIKDIIYHCKIHTVQIVFYVYKGLWSYCQLHRHFWLLDQLGNSLIRLAMAMNHEDCQFQVSDIGVEKQG
jgi:hypothetical protein